MSLTGASFGPVRLMVLKILTMNIYCGFELWEKYKGLYKPVLFLPFIAFWNPTKKINFPTLNLYLKASAIHTARTGESAG